MRLHLGGQTIDLGRFLQEHPIEPGQDKRIDRIASGPGSSVHVVQMTMPEKPHHHATHDLRVVILRGRGTMVIAGREVKAGPGSIFEIDRGTSHWFIPKRKSTVAALATYSPPFDGKDHIHEEP